MTVRIRLRLPARQSGTQSIHQQAALMLALLMTPVAFTAWALAGWRLAADLKWTGEFAIQSGLFSRWQVWVALAIMVQFIAFLLHRYARRDVDPDDPALS